MGYWQVRCDGSVRQYLEKIRSLTTAEQNAYRDALNILTSDPYPGNYPLGTIAHMKGKAKCNHEYRKLPNGRRLIYKIWSRADLQTVAEINREAFVWDDATKNGEVHVYYAGPHPESERDYNKIGSKMQKPISDA